MLLFMFSHQLCGFGPQRFLQRLVLILILMIFPISISMHLSVVSDGSSGPETPYCWFSSFFSLGQSFASRFSWPSWASMTLLISSVSS